MEEIKYTPSEIDLRHMQEIRDFLNEEEIPFEESTETFGLIYVNDRTTELRYVDSYYFPIDNSKRFGEKCKGVDKNYFSIISHEKFDKGIRVLWIFDFEMEQRNPDDFVDNEGNKLPGFRRQWEVIKNTIRTACGRIHYRFFARDCEVCIVPTCESRPFLMTNCFYGFRAATVQLGLRLKKDKYGFKKGTLLFYFSFGMNFYGNKNKEQPKVEVIRASTKLYCQVIGGISKCVKYFCENYPTIIVAGKEVAVDKIVYYTDASHNDGRGMRNSSSSFEFVSWDINGGFMNMFTEDVDEDGLKGRKSEIFQRRPMFHKQIMKLISEGKIISIGNAGTIVHEMSRKKFLEDNGNGHQ